MKLLPKKSLPQDPAEQARSRAAQVQHAADCLTSGLFAARIPVGARAATAMIARPGRTRRDHPVDARLAADNRNAAKGITPKDKRDPKLEDHLRWVCTMTGFRHARTPRAVLGVRIVSVSNTPPANTAVAPVWVRGKAPTLFTFKVALELGDLI